MWGTVLQIGANAAASGAATAAGAYAVRRLKLAEPHPLAVAFGTATVVLTVSTAARHLQQQKKP